MLQGLLIEIHFTRTNNHIEKESNPQTATPKTVNINIKTFLLCVEYILFILLVALMIGHLSIGCYRHRIDTGWAWQNERRYKHRINFFSQGINYFSNIMHYLRIKLRRNIVRLAFWRCFTKLGSTIIFRQNITYQKYSNTLLWSEQWCM